MDLDQWADRQDEFVIAHILVDSGAIPEDVLTDRRKSAEATKVVDTIAKAMYDHIDKVVALAVREVAEREIEVIDNFDETSDSFDVEWDYIPPGAGNWYEPDYVYAEAASGEYEVVYPSKASLLGEAYVDLSDLDDVLAKTAQRLRVPWNGRLALAELKADRWDVIKERVWDAAMDESSTTIPVDGGLKESILEGAYELAANYPPEGYEDYDVPYTFTCDKTVEMKVVEFARKQFPVYEISMEGTVGVSLD